MATDPVPMGYSPLSLKPRRLQPPFSETTAILQQDGGIESHLPCPPDPTQRVTTRDLSLASVLYTLPTTFRDRQHRVHDTMDDIEGYIERDLDVSRLNRIHGLLWMAGRPMNARPLHRQKMMDRRILYTEQADLHLLWVEDRMFLKPLPAYLLSHEFWTKYLCNLDELHRRACGFLLSYVWLVCSELDFRMACELHLLPAGVTWPWWKSFVSEFLSSIDANALDQVNKRYQFGELRLGRVNTIYRVRFFHTHFVRGYLYDYNRYVAFFSRNFGWLLVIFVYFSLVLSAMQVGVAVSPLDKSEAFHRASYGFVVFSIVTVAAVVGLVGAIFVFTFAFNTVWAISHARREEQRRMKIAQARSNAPKP